MSNKRIFISLFFLGFFFLFSLPFLQVQKSNSSATQISLDTPVRAAVSVSPASEARYHYAESFDSMGYQSEGDLWLNDWTESGEPTDAGNGVIRIVAYDPNDETTCLTPCLRIGGTSSAGRYEISRSFEKECSHSIHPVIISTLAQNSVTDLSCCRQNARASFSSE